MQKNIIKNLEFYRPLNDQEDLQGFILLVTQIVKSGNPEDIPILLSFFSDNSDYIDVMQFLLTELEEYPPEKYIPKLLESLPILLVQAPQWLVTIVVRMFNDEYCLRIFKKNMMLVPTDSMSRLVDLIEKESEYHSNICKELRQLLDKTSSF